MDKSQAIELIRSSGLSQHSEVLIAHLAPSARIVVADDAGVSSEKSGLSYFGGLPRLPNGGRWPFWDSRDHENSRIARLEEKFRQNPRATGLRDIAAKMRDGLAAGPTPLTFLAQLDLAELADSVLLDGWPTAGTMLFFYGGGWGFDPLEKGSSCVLYFPAGILLNELNELAGVGECRAYPKRQVRFRREWTLPCSPRKDWPKDDYRALREKLLTAVHEPIHRSGGWPEEVQGEMRFECQLVTNGIYCGDPSGFRDPRAKSLEPGATDWTLLLQLDSNDKLGWMWGDAGRVYFWAKQHDIVETDFGSTWAIQQCY
jgi:uncharacterized protein YwqG